MKKLLILIYCNLLFKFKLFVQLQNFYLFRNIVTHIFKLLNLMDGAAMLLSKP